MPELKLFKRRWHAATGEGFAGDRCGYCSWRRLPSAPLRPTCRRQPRHPRPAPPPLAADTLPVLTALLCLFHVLWFVPYLTGRCRLQPAGALGSAEWNPAECKPRSTATGSWLLACYLSPACLAPPLHPAGQWSIESTGIKFDCSQGTLLRVASYSLFALFGAAALNELALTVLGLRGKQQGPARLDCYHANAGSRHMPACLLPTAVSWC